MKTLENTKMKPMNITFSLPSRLGKKINNLPPYVIVNIFEDYIQSNNNKIDEEELAFDKAAIEAFNSKKWKEITRKFVEHAKVREIHNPIKI